MNRYKESYVQAYDGTRIYYLSQGEGVPLVLCDGIGCDGYAWKYLTEHLAATNRLIHYHYRGHANSGKPANGNHYTIQDNVRDLIAVLDDDGVDKAVLVGHSMGAQVILEAYRMHPERVMGLIPVCGSYGRPLDTFHDNKLLKTIFPGIYTFAVLFPEVIEAVWHRIVPTKFALFIAKHTEVNGRLLLDDDFYPYLQFIGKIDVRMFVKMLDHASRHTAEDILHTIDVPTLIIAGEHDTFTPMWLSEKMHAAIRGSEFLVIPDGTHTAPIENPELADLRIEKFLLDHFPQQVARQYGRLSARSKIRVVA
jgi:pimeloyl-ACP methyl ester carboxylesterase